eukprot:3205829-Amphidinium_carterae.1
MAGSLSTWIVECPNQFSMTNFFNFVSWCLVTLLRKVGIAIQSPVIVSTQAKTVCTCHFLTVGRVDLV